MRPSLTPVRPSAAILYQATSAGLDTDPLIKGFLGGYCLSGLWLAYNVFVTGMQATLLSQVTVGVVFPIVIFLNYSALSDAGRHSYSQGTRPAQGDEIQAGSSHALFC